MAMKKKFTIWLITLLYKFNYRILIFEPFKGIGHQSTEPACYVIEKKLKFLPYKIILYFPRSEDYESTTKLIHLLKLWKRYFVTYVFDNETNWLDTFKFKILRTILKTQPLVNKKYNLVLDNNYHVISKKISNRAMELNKLYTKPLLKVKKETQKKGLNILRELGIPKNAWYVLFHNRESKFMSSFEGAPYLYESLYSHRNDPFELYDDAIKYILSIGGYCIRFGHYFDKLPKNRDSRIIDYPMTKYHSPEMDLFLMQNCKFYLGANSGPAQTVGYFGKPVVQVNGTPFIGLPYFKFDIGLLKLYYSENENRFLTFSEIISNKLLLNSNDINDFTNAGIKLVSNTSEEISEACREMIRRLDKSEVDTEEDMKLQKEFISLFSPVDYCYNYPGKVSKFFINRHRHLLK